MNRECRGCTHRVCEGSSSAVGTAQQLCPMMWVAPLQIISVDAAQSKHGALPVCDVGEWEHP